MGGHGGHNDVAAEGNSTLAWLLAEDHSECSHHGSPVGQTTMHAFQWIGSMICVLQCLYFLSKWPRFTWDTPYIPAVEAVGYGLMANAYGYAPLFAGEREVPWLRYSIWVISTPVLLWDIQEILDAHYRGTRLAPLMSLANLMLLLFGFIGALEHVLIVKYVCYGIGCMMLVLVYFCAYHIISEAVQNFEGTGTDLGRQVSLRLKMIAVVFMTSFSGYPILWLVSNQALCVIPEMVIEIMHIPLDLIAKNFFTFLTWHTHFVLLNGSWSHEDMVKRLNAEEDIEMQEGKEPEKVRKALMQKAQAFFGLADACLKHADSLMSKASNPETELSEMERLIEEPLPSCEEHLKSFTGKQKTGISDALAGTRAGNAGVVQTSAIYQSLQKVSPALADSPQTTGGDLSLNAPDETGGAGIQEKTAKIAAALKMNVGGKQSPNPVETDVSGVEDVTPTKEAKGPIYPSAEPKAEVGDKTLNVVTEGEEAGAPDNADSPAASPTPKETVYNV